MAISLSKKDLIWSYLGTILSMSANFLMLPVIIYFLDSDMLGLWYVFSSIGAVAILLDFGFSITFSRNITYCWSGSNELKKEGVSYSTNTSPNFILMKKTIESCKYIYLIISSIALFLLLTVGSYYIYSISADITGYEHFVAWCVYSFAIFFNLYYGYYSSFLRGVGAIAQANKNTVIARSVQILLTVILLFSGFGIIGACIAYLAYGSVFRMLGKYYFYNYNGLGNSLNSIICDLPKSEIFNIVKIIWHNAWKDGIIAITNFVCNQATTIICSLYFTLTETGVYSLSVQIAVAVSAISGTYYMASQPALQSAYVDHDLNRTKSIMSIIVSSYVLLFLLCTIGVLVIVIPFINWLKPDLLISYSVITALCFYHFLLKLRDCYGSYFSSSNRIIYLKSYILSSLFCIVFSFVFCHFFNIGIWGLIVSQIVSQLFFNVWYWPYKANKELDTNFLTSLINGCSLIYKGITNLKFVFT